MQGFNIWWKICDPKLIVGLLHKLFAGVANLFQKDFGDLETKKSD